MKLDPEEKELLEEFEKGNFRRVKNYEKAKREAIAAARNTLNKTKNINIGKGSLLPFAHHFPVLLIIYFFVTGGFFIALSENVYQFGEQFIGNFIGKSDLLKTLISDKGNGFLRNGV